MIWLHEKHRYAVRAVMNRNADEVAKDLLQAAEAAGLIRDTGDGWELTSIGADLMTSY